MRGKEEERRRGGESALGRTSPTRPEIVVDWLGRLVGWLVVGSGSSQAAPRPGGACGFISALQSKCPPRSFLKAGMSDQHPWRLRSLYTSK